MEVPLPSPKLAVHSLLLYFSCCGLLNGCQDLPSTGVGVNEQSSGKLKLVSSQRLNWHIQVSPKRVKSYMMCWLNYLYFISNSATKNDGHFINRLVSLFKDWLTEDATRIQNTWGTEISGFVIFFAENLMNTQKNLKENLCLYFMNKKPPNLTRSKLSWKIHFLYCQACYCEFYGAKEEGKERTAKQARTCFSISVAWKY